MPNQLTTIVLNKDLKQRIHEAREKCGYSERQLQKFLNRLIDCAEQSPAFFQKS